MLTLMIPHSLFLLETEDGVEAIQDECQSPLVVARSTRDGAVHEVPAPESRQCNNRCVVQTWARWNKDSLALKKAVVHGRHRRIQQHRAPAG